MSNKVAQNVANMPMDGYNYRPIQIQAKHSTFSTIKTMALYKDYSQKKKEAFAIEMTMKPVQQLYDFFFKLKQDAIYNLTQGDEEQWDHYTSKYVEVIDQKNDAVADMYVDMFDTEDFWNKFYLPKQFPLD